MYFSQLCHNLISDFEEDIKEASKEDLKKLAKLFCSVSPTNGQTTSTEDSDDDIPTDDDSLLSSLCSDTPSDSESCTDSDDEVFRSFNPKSMRGSSSHISFELSKIQKCCLLKKVLC